MAFSDTVVQQREKQENLLKRFLIYSIAGSIALHGMALFLKVNRFGQPNDLASEEITIVAAEPALEEEPEATIPVETDFADVPGGGGFSGSGGAPAVTSIEAPSPDVALSAEAPEPSPLPIAEENAVTEEGAETAETRDLSSLLENLRRIRQQSSQTVGEGRVGTVGNGSGGTAAVGTGNGNGNGSGTGNGNGSGTGNGTGSGTGSGTGEGTGIGEASPGENRARRGSQSREITCRGCDFDYPDSADGAEGTAQVIVETDAQGQVVSVTLSRSSGNAALDRAALEQAQRRVRLNNARAGENYPIDIDFVQPDSEAAQRVRERGDRHSITVSDPESAPETETPETATNQAPEPEPSATAEPSVRPEPSASPESEQNPSRLPASGQADNTDASEPAAETDSPSEPSATETDEPSVRPEPESSASPESEQNPSMSRPEPPNSPAPVPATPAPAPSQP